MGSSVTNIYNPTHTSTSFSSKKIEMKVVANFLQSKHLLKWNDWYSQKKCINNAMTNRNAKFNSRFSICQTFQERQTQGSLVR